MIAIKKQMISYIAGLFLLGNFAMVVRATPQEKQLIMGVPVSIRFEHHSFETWFVQVLLNRQDYSKTNLELIWKYYCEKYPNKKDKLDIRVYIDNPNKTQAYDSLYDAIFYRQGEGLLAGGGENEFYKYKSDLDKSSDWEKVQLKGTYPFLRETYRGISNLDFVVAARKGDISRINESLKGGMDPNVRDETGRTALMAACKNGDTELVKTLLAHQADINIKNEEGETALYNAVMAVIKDTQEKDGWRWGCPEVVKILLENGADVNVAKDSWTPLLCAASHGNDDIVKMMIDKGADINAKTATGMTPLIRALYDGKEHTAKILLAAGADINLRDNNGNTALMLAATGYVEVTRLLLDAQVNVNVVNDEGETALKIAKRNKNNDQIILMLLKAGAKE